MIRENDRRIGVGDEVEEVRSSQAAEARNRDRIGIKVRRSDAAALENDALACGVRHLWGAALDREGAGRARSGANAACEAAFVLKGDRPFRPGKDSDGAGVAADSTGHARTANDEARLGGE